MLQRAPHLPKASKTRVGNVFTFCVSWWCNGAQDIEHNYNSWLWFRSAGLFATLARSHVRISCADLKMRAIEHVHPVYRSKVASHRFKRWRNGGWKQLPVTTLYGEYELVNLVGLIPSLASRSD
jgi:hypothetical protein